VLSRFLSARTLAGPAALLMAVSVTSCAGGPFSAPAAFQVDPVYLDPELSGSVDQLKPITDFCGDRPIKVALADGVGDNAFRKTARAEFEDEAAKCPNLELLPYADGQNNPQKAISDIKALVALGVDALVVFPDAGPALLPTLREAFEAGVAVVPYTASPGGTSGVDYTTFVGHNTVTDGAMWARWVCDALGTEGGNAVFLGGTPGNAQSLSEIHGIEAELANNSDCKNVTLLNEPGTPIDTGWNPAQTQRVTAGLLAKYPKIDAVITDSGDGSLGGIRAFLQAGRPLPVWTANDVNGFACAYVDNKPKQPQFQVVAVTSRTWIVRLALRKAVAAAQHLPEPEPDIVNVPIVMNSLDPELAPECDPNLPASAVTSSELSTEKLAEIYR
jgi:ribose transport system substrate-binding protein